MRGLSLSLILFFVSQFAHALTCQSLLAKHYILTQPVEAARGFYDVEVFRRNNDVGMQQLGDLSFSKWLELDFIDDQVQSVVGLTEKGEVYHLVHFGTHRTIARRLSGLKVYEHFFISSRGDLFAVDAKNKVHHYSNKLWHKSPIQKVIKKALSIGVPLSVAGLAALNISPPYSFQSFAENFLRIEAYEAVAPVMTLLSTFFISLRKYEVENTYPDGFVKLPFSEQEVVSMSAVELSQHIDDRDQLKVDDESSLRPSLPEGATEPIH